MNIFWFRRDLRIEDNIGLYHALNAGQTTCIFIFDTDILDKLEDKSDRRVQLIHDTLKRIDLEFRKYQSSLKVYHGRPIEVWKEIIKEFEPKQVFFNKDYEPSAIERDKSVVELLNSHQISHQKFLDHIIFQPNEILKADMKPYTIYTPYSRRWKEKLTQTKIQEFPSESLLSNLSKLDSDFPSIEILGFKKTEYELPIVNIEENYLKKYEANRNLPSLNYTSHLSTYLRFGLVSIRQIVWNVRHEEKFLNELIWREFFIQILYHFPSSVQNSFKPKYDRIQWSNDENLFQKWCEGKTGFPLIDAGMRELNATGLMHNRVRMLVASFLVKNLWIDWRWGEAYFAAKLLDYELSSNIGNWQWASSSGCDAAPYFRIFNPQLQTEKFDPDHHYIRKWIPEYGTDSYPSPIIDYSSSRDQALKKYKEALNE